MRTNKINKMRTKIINGWEYERELHTEMNTFSKIKIPKGWKLITFGELMLLWNDYREDFNFGKDNRFNEIVENPLKEKRKKYPYWNVWLAGLADGSGVCGYYRDSSYLTVRGVRFKRKVKNENK